ncbi:thiamine-phosphate kinase [Limnochorda pilosa]|uniref:Thiamine-monophosphate kinase n=1 Tax=Limnochorda pilosa TaxID=1555112 RepID=A0A0K2SJF2_LIMPI|nr:thiamine-phosphate kinase [Limnochorda pilosa]BAS27233.1 thiamine-monophosphate kinase [Limnochorda pilosa]
MPGEFEIIERIRRQVGPPGPGVLQGIGDDAAVLEAPGATLLASSDALVEGIHFHLSYMSPRQVGRKAMAVNLSDVGSMGGRPLFALVTLGLRRGLPEGFLDELYAGLLEMGRTHGTQVVGGDTVTSPERFFIDVAILGVPGEGPPVLRSGARVGDRVAVTAPLGASGAGLAWLLAEREERLPAGARGAAQEAVLACVRAHLEPTPRVQAGQALAACGAVHAMMDISDGLASEVNHVARESGVGIRVRGGDVPVAPEASEMGRLLDADPFPWALSGGEDYELLFTYNPAAEDRVQAALAGAGLRLHVLGEVTRREEGVTLEREGQLHPLPPAGYVHLQD